MPESEVTLVISEWQEPAKIDPELSFSQDATIYLLDEFSAADYLINQYNVPVTYTSSNTSVATVDNTGALTIIDVGDITITASFAGDSTYEADSATMTVIIEDSSTPDIKFTSIYPQYNNDTSDLPEPIAGKYVVSDYEPITEKDDLDLGFVEKIVQKAQESESILMSIDGTDVYPELSIDETDEEQQPKVISITGTDYISGDTYTYFTLSHETSGESENIWTMTPNQEVLQEDSIVCMYFSSGLSFVAAKLITNENEEEIGTRIIFDGVVENGSYLDLYSSEFTFKNVEALFIDDTEYYVPIEDDGNGGYQLTDGVDTLAYISNIADGESDYNWIISTGDGNTHYIGLTVTDIEPEQ